MTKEVPRTSVLRDEELNKTLIARLRDEHVAASRNEAADRIELLATTNEQLVATNEALSISNATLIAERDAAEDRAVRLGAAMETLRPVWAQGWSGESVAAQASATALAQLWQMLGASNQTEAVTALRAALARVKSKEGFSNEKGVM